VNLLHLTIRDGRRVSAWNAFVQPVLDSPLLTVVTGSPVARVLVEGGRARGVEIIEDGRLTAVRCSSDGGGGGEVVLSCGTIGSAQLLLSADRSGRRLRALGNRLVVARSARGFGRQPARITRYAPVVYESARPVPSGHGPSKIEAAVLREDRSRAGRPRPAAVMSHVPLPFVGQEVPEEEARLQRGPGTIRTLSRGRLWLRSADPTQAPALDPRYFAEPYDLRAIGDGGQAGAGDRGSRRRSPSGVPARSRPVREWSPTTRSPRTSKRNPDQLSPPGRYLPYGHRARRGRGPATFESRRAGCVSADASVMPGVPSGNYPRDPS